MSHQTLTLTHESARVARVARVTLANPPLALVDPEVLSELHAVVDELEAGSTQVVIFESADPDYFMNHVDLLRAGEIDRTPDPESGFGPWLHLLHRLEQAPFITVGAVRGRARGAGNEFVLALDVVFASEERAIFGQPELTIGIIPGGGGLQRILRKSGRARAIETIVGASDLDARTAAEYGWINRAVPDAELDGVTRAFAERVAAWDAAAVATAKSLLTATSAIPAEEYLHGEQAFLGLLVSEQVQQRMPAMFGAGLQQPGDFERDLADASFRAITTVAA